MSGENQQLSVLLSNYHFSEDTSGYRISNPVRDKGVQPLGVVRPANTQELQEVIAKAGESGVGLVAVSSSAPHCKGGTICDKDHVIVDLSGWKTCDTIDRRNRVCRIEAGVTFGELLAALEPRGLTVPMPLAPRSGKSVIAAVMDREPLTWPNKQWDTTDPICSTEFIFGSGDLFRTGAAGGPGSLEKQRAVGGAQKNSMGPSQTDFHRVVQGSQGSMGIVTWITIRAEIKPRIEEPRLIENDDLGKIIPFVYEVQRPWLGEHSFILNRTALGMLMAGGDKGKFDTIRKSLPEFVCLQNIVGFERLPEDRVAYQLKDISDIAVGNGLHLHESIGEVTARGLLRAATKPCGETDWRHAMSGHCLDVFFLTTLDRAPEFMGIFLASAKDAGVDRDRVGVYIQPVVQNHSCHVEFMVAFNPSDAGEVERMKTLEKSAVKKLMDAGAFFSRPYGPASNAVFERNKINTELLRKIKAIFDPKNIFNPDKFGLSRGI